MVDGDSREGDNLQRSLLAPMIFGVNSSAGSMEQLYHVAELVAASIPIGLYAVNYGGKKQSVRRQVHRRVGRVFRPDGREVDVRYVDEIVGSGARQTHALQWQLSLVPGGDAELFPSLASGQTPVVVTVAVFRLFRKRMVMKSNGGKAPKDIVVVECGKQLALARFAVCEAFRALDSEVTVSSVGQIAWDKQWWPSLLVPTGENNTSTETDPKVNDGVLSPEPSPTPDMLSGAVLDNTPHCRSCGMQNRPASRYCTKCGELLVDTLGSHD